jgi:uncharacterized protein
MKPLIRCAVVALMLTPVAGVAQDFNAGLAAAQAGDFATALKEWQPLAAQGEARAQYNLGLMYDNGHGVSQDYASAFAWYKLAAVQGEARAQYNLGVMYENGDGASQDYAEAAGWYRRAAVQGEARAQYNLGLMYYNGHGVPQDYASAHMWFNIAAANGAGSAARNRDIVGGKMNAPDISEAQRRARVCINSGYRECD